MVKTATSAAMTGIARLPTQLIPSRYGNDCGLAKLPAFAFAPRYRDKLDVAVIDAYGWPADLSDTDILARLVALNAERAREESEGLIRWLRPEYQIPRFGSVKDKLALIGGAMRGAQAAQPSGAKPSFPTDNVAQTASVMAALASATAPIGVEALATGFRQGRRAVPQIGAVLAALVRMGFVASPDGGRTYIMRRAA
jgi:hypothetical protein